jgi:hypothetical protein
MGPAADKIVPYFNVRFEVRDTLERKQIDASPTVALNKKDCPNKKLNHFSFQFRLHFASPQMLDWAKIAYF